LIIASRRLRRTVPRMTRRTWLSRLLVATMVGAALLVAAPTPALAAVDTDALQSPAATRTSAGRIDVFITRLSDLSVQQLYLDTDGSQHGWFSLGRPPSGAASRPTATWIPDGSRIDVLVRGQDRNLYQKFWTGAGGWSGWVNLGGPVAQAPSASWRDSGRLDIFTLGTDGLMYQLYWTPSGWHGYFGFAAPPSGAAFGPRIQWNRFNNRLDVALPGFDGELYHKFWTSSGWTGWNALHGDVASSASVAWQGNGGGPVGLPYRFDIFSITNSGALAQEYFESTTGWHGPFFFDTLPSGMTAPSAVWDDPGRFLAVFGSSANGLYVKYWNSLDGWFNWQLIAVLP
jgi:hypothetical protein